MANLSDQIIKFLKEKNYCTLYYIILYYYEVIVVIHIKNYNNMGT